MVDLSNENLPVEVQLRREGGRFVRFAGAAGFLAKGLIYIGCGVLILVSAFQGSSGGNRDESPQGVFKRVSQMSSGLGVTLLSLLLVGILMYAVWRLFEAVTAVGLRSEPRRVGKLKAFFSYRLSPFISACVYLSYAAFCIRLLLSVASSPVCFPACWRDTVWGTVLLALLGLAFAIAVVTQLIPAVTGSFRKDMRSDRMQVHPARGRAFVLLGRVGFLGRAALFASLSALFFAFVLWPRRARTSGSTISQALDAFTGKPGGRVILFLIGITVTCYGVFAALNAHYKRFTTESVLP